MNLIETLCKDKFGNARQTLHVPHVMYKRAAINTVGRGDGQWIVNTIDKGRMHINVCLCDIHNRASISREQIAKATDFARG